MPASCCRQLLTLQKKNVVLRTRVCCGCALWAEILLPSAIIFFLGVIKLSFDDTVFTAKYPEYTTIPSLPSFYDPAIAQDSRDTLFLTCDDGWFQDERAKIIKADTKASPTGGPSPQQIAVLSRYQAFAQELSGNNKHCVLSKIAIFPESASGNAQTAATNYAKWLKKDLVARYGGNLDSSRLSDAVLSLKDKKDFDDYVLKVQGSPNDYSPLSSAIMFGKAGDAKWEYTIRFNTSIYVPSTQFAMDLTARAGVSYSSLYLRSSFMSFQESVQAFARKAAPGSDIPTVKVAGNFPTFGYKTNGFWGMMNVLYGLIMCVTMVTSVAFVTKEIVGEKETRVREAMFIMGLSRSSYYLSWFFTFMALYVPSALLATVTAIVFIFNGSNFLLILIYIYLFMLSSFSFSFFLSSFFARAKTAQLVGLIVWFATGLVPFAMGLMANIPLAALRWLSLFPVVAFANSAAVFGKLLDNNIGVDFDVLHFASGAGWTLADSLLHLSIDIVLFFILGIYFDHVIPSGLGVAQPFYYFVLPSYWCPGAHKGKNVEIQSDALDAVVEPVSSELEEQEGENRTLAVRSLRREFKNVGGKACSCQGVTKVAVDNLTMTFYEGQITALLGHNGAGKTTTMSMLTGMLPVSAGTATIQGRDIRYEMAEIRHFTGLCPQHDILWGDLTVQEHMDIYAELKGLDPETKEQECEALIVAVGLANKVKKKTKGLSGGMRRKLSLAIALMGSNTKVVLLDEPTSGMDPWSRRSTWDIIKSFRDNRIIVLTTHFMDEADLLGDRIAIMSSGRLICCGSSLFLKERYGVGYSLTMVLTEADQAAQAAAVQQLTDVMNQHLPTEPPVVTGREVTFRLPSQESSKFPPLLRALSALTGREDPAAPAAGTGGVIEDVGLSITTLEEVFLRVGHATTGADADPAPESKSETSKVSPESKFDNSEGASSKVVTEGLMARHFRAMMKKRVTYFCRDCQSWCCQLILPLVMLIFGVIYYKVAPLIVLSTNSLELSTDKYNLQVSPDSGLLPLPLPYTTGFDSANGCSASCEWWCEQEYYPCNSKEKTNNMCASLHCGGCDRCKGSGGSGCAVPTQTTTAKPSATASPKKHSVESWVQHLASVTPHVDVQPSRQPNEIEYILPGRQVVSDVPYTALQNYLLRTSGPSTDDTAKDYLLVGGDSWEKMPQEAKDMKTCDKYFYLYSYKDQATKTCPAQGTFFGPATTAKGSNTFSDKGSWALQIPGQDPVVFACADATSALCQFVSSQKPHSYSCQINEGKLDAKRMFGGKPGYGHKASRFGAYVYNTIPGFTTRPKSPDLKKAPSPATTKAAATKAPTKSATTNAKATKVPAKAKFDPKVLCANATAAIDTSTTAKRTATCPNYLLAKLDASLFMLCLQQITGCLTVLKPPNTCTDAFPKQCSTLATNGQCDETRRKVCCASCKKMNSGGSFDVTVLPNGTSPHGAPVFTNLFFNSLLTAMRADPAKTKTEFVQNADETTTLPVPAELRVSSYPFDPPLTTQGLATAMSAFTLTIIVTIALSFVPPTFALFIVREKEFKQRHQQNVSGLSSLIYWLSNFAYDFISFMVVLTIVFIVFIQSRVEGLVGTPEAAVACYLNFLFFALSVIPFIYVFTFLFKKHNAALIALILLTLLSGFVLIMVAFMIQMFIPSARDTNKYLEWIVYRLFPPYNMASAIMALTGTTLQKQLAKAGMLPKDHVIPGPFHWNTTGEAFVYMGSEFVIYSALVVLLETGMLCRLCTKTAQVVSGSADAARGDEDVDVHRERDRVLGIADVADLEAPKPEGCQDTVQVRDVYKYYGSVKAVRGITFGIDVGTCFGLLGINGAGKTTTFSMLTGENTPTHGQLLVAGIDVVRNPDKIKRLVGYCPQFDALWDKLTARQHLHLYGAIKGVPEDKMVREVNSILASMGLNDFADKMAGGYSGGNKRKLSVGIALIGNPRIVFLDEPSTGMDPVARRQMWDIISQVTTRDKSCCTVLTTHSMEECEALCTRICIMVAGRLKCIGSGQHLKARFGKCFTVEIALDLPTEEQKDAFQLSIFESMNKGSSSTPVPKEVEMSSLGPKSKSAGAARSKSLKRSKSVALDRNIALAPLFENDGARVTELLKAMGVETKFPWFHASIAQTPFGGLEPDMSARDAGIFIMERERLLRMKAFMCKNFPELTLKEEFGNTLRYQIPTTDPNGVKRELADMFALIEADKEQLCIQNYAIGQMSLEEIFNIFAAQDDNPDNARYKQKIEKESSTKGVDIKKLSSIMHGDE